MTKPTRERRKITSDLDKKSFDGVYVNLKMIMGMIPRDNPTYEWERGYTAAVNIAQAYAQRALDILDRHLDKEILDEEK